MESNPQRWESKEIPSKSIAPLITVGAVFWSDERLASLCNAIERHGINDEQSLNNLEYIIFLVSPKKKAYLYRRLSELGYSPGLIERLFGPWTPGTAATRAPAPRGIRESTWQAVRP